jgi:hypothetical protein
MVLKASSQRRRLYAGGHLKNVSPKSLFILEADFVGGMRS